MSTPASLAVDAVTVRFGERLVLNRFSLSAEPGEIVGLLGSSGSGKSTVLRVIAGLLVPDEGRVLVDGVDISHVPTHRRNIGYVFQDHQLFAHLDVAGNIGYGLAMARVPRAERARRVTRLLALVDMAGREHDDVTTLSGGESQRVALARSLAPEPRLLLLDEPFSALDRDLHDRLVFETRTLLKRLQVTAVHVTHDHDEASEMCDRAIRLPD